MTVLKKWLSRAAWRGALLGAACGSCPWLFTLTPFGRGAEDWLQDANFAYRGPRATSTEDRDRRPRRRLAGEAAQADGRRQPRAGRLKRSGRFEDVLIDDPFDPEGQVAVKLTEEEWQSVTAASIRRDTARATRLQPELAIRMAECGFHARRLTSCSPSPS